MIKSLRRFAFSLVMNSQIAAGFIRFLWSNKLGWLTPLVVVLFVFGLLFGLASVPVVGPFIYTLF